MKLSCVPVFMFLSLSPRFSHASMRQQAVSFDPVKPASLDVPGPVFSPVSKVACTAMCIQSPACSSVVYWRSEGKCTTSTNLKNVQTDPKSKAFYAVLRNVTENAEHYIYFKEIGLSLKHHRDRKAWHDASDECYKENATLFAIDNQKKQDIAKQLVKFSGHAFIFFGVYRDFPYWQNCDGNRLNYTSWAPREPHLPCFAALGRSSDYLWVTTGQHDTASYICKRNK